MCYCDATTHHHHYGEFSSQEYLPVKERDHTGLGRKGRVELIINDTVHFSPCVVT